jgi:hypothetical protein
VGVSFNALFGSKSGGVKELSDAVYLGFNSATVLKGPTCLGVNEGSTALVAAGVAGGGGSGTSSAGACFAATERVTLESGVTKAMADVKVGDRVLTVNTKGQAVYSDVVYLPHGSNTHPTMFAVIATASGRDLKMTMNHILPAGACALSSLPLVAARQIAVGDCVQTVSGCEQVVSVDKVEGKGIYTIVAMEELIVVNGIVATPFGGVNPTLANAYYNLHRLAYAGCGAAVKAANGWMQGAMEGVWVALSGLSSL